MLKKKQKLHTGVVAKGWAGKWAVTTNWYKVSFGVMNMLKMRLW